MPVHIGAELRNHLQKVVFIPFHQTGLSVKSASFLLFPSVLVTIENIIRFFIKKVKYSHKNLQTFRFFPQTEASRNSFRQPEWKVIAK